MGEHFYSVVLPRMKKVLFYDKSGISKEVKEYQGGGFFKYQYLEQYEDTLHNIEFKNEEKRDELFKFFDEEAKREYLIKYFLRYETKGSQCLLNYNNFENPFEYKLKIISNKIPHPDLHRDTPLQKGNGEEIVDVDLVETFNYLFGLKVKKYKFLEENRKKYVFVFGERRGSKVVIVWRDKKEIDLQKDKEIIEKNINEFKPEEIFGNGDSLVKDYKPIEYEFKRLMGVKDET